MRKIFDAELTAIGDDLTEMAKLVEVAITKAGQALATADLQIAQEVIEGDAEIDGLQRKLDEECVHILAQQAPVATDLRHVIVALRLSSTLERMGDLARHVAEVARGRFPALALPEIARGTFGDLDAAAVAVAREVVALMEDHDLEAAQELERNDDTIDDLHAQTFDALLGAEWTGTVQESIDVTLLGRYYERFGDHAVNVARRIVFLITGEFDADRDGLH